MADDGGATPLALKFPTAACSKERKAMTASATGVRPGTATSGAVGATALRVSDSGSAADAPGEGGSSSSRTTQGSDASTICTSACRARCRRTSWLGPGCKTSSLRATCKRVLSRPAGAVTGKCVASRSKWHNRAARQDRPQTHRPPLRATPAEHGRSATAKPGPPTRKQEFQQKPAPAKQHGPHPCEATT